MFPCVIVLFVQPNENESNASNNDDGERSSAKERRKTGTGFFVFF
jgi:hypothetical protein